MKNAAEGGHLLVRVRKLETDNGSDAYADAYATIDKKFVLRAAGHADVEAYASRGFWLDSSQDVRDFYVHIDPPQFARMARGVAYTLEPVDATSSTRWEVSAGVTVAKP
jgi:hypothetical protein